MSGPALFDPGLQPERTDLAWRRTLLAVAVGALVSLRLLPPVLGTWSLGVGLAGLLACGVLWPVVSRRVRRTREALLRSSGPLPGGGLLLGVAVLVAVGAALALVGVVLLVGRGS